MRNNQIAKFFILVLTAFLWLEGLNATNYYVDPSKGKIENKGTEKKPWNTLEAVFKAGKTFLAGDTIFLKNGDHGFPIVNQTNSGNVVMVAYPGHNPVVNRIEFREACHWVLEGVRVYTSANPPGGPVLEHPVYPKEENFLVFLGGSDTIILSNCYIYSEENTASWSADDWNNKAWNGIRVGYGDGITIKNCLIKNVNFGIHFTHTSGNLTQYNTLKNFCGDGMRTSSNSVLEYNEILDAYYVNGNHDDAIQGFASKNVIIRGNKIISVTAPRDFQSYSLQGMGLFDGFFDNYTIENNLIVIHTWHGISILGARNCKIVNNTLIDNPIGLYEPGPPWISIYKNKKGGENHDNIIRNNITSGINETVGTIVDNNIITTNYEAHFVDYKNNDYHLKAVSSAINAGSSEFAPTIDLDRKQRVLPYDIGCYEFISKTSDKTPPSAPEDVKALEVSISGVKLTWNSSPEKDVTGYRVYGGGDFPIITLDTFAVVKSLVVDSTFKFIVTAVDSSGNESNRSNEITAIIPFSGELNSEMAWNTIRIPKLTKTFTITFDAIPLADSMDAVFSMSEGIATGFGGLACIIRFGVNGKIDARDGKNYTAANEVKYKVGLLYRMKIKVNVKEKTYSVFITPKGSSEIVLGEHMAFRTEQANIPVIGGMTLYHKTGGFLVKNLNLNKN